MEDLLRKEAHVHGITIAGVNKNMSRKLSRVEAIINGMRVDGLTDYWPE